MKKHVLILTVLALTYLVLFPVAVFAGTPVLVINDKAVQSEVPPQIIKDRVLVPIRVISEALGAKVTWENSTRTVTIESNNTVLKLQIDKDTAYVGDKAVHLDVPAQLIQDRTFVPLRFIGESLNSEVAWDSSNYRVIIKQITKQINNRTLSQVTFQETDSQTVISLKVAEGSNKIARFKNPERLAIDLPDTTKAVDSTFTLNTKLVSTLRVGQFNTSTTRVVLDLKEQVKYQVSQSANTLTVTLNPSVPPQSPGPAPGDGSNNAGPGSSDSINKNLVVVDAGHGGSDVGAVGISGRYEKDINLAIALKLQSALEARGFQVVMTRKDDTFVSLDGRVQIANNTNAFAFVSVHSNKFSGPGPNGVETYTFYGSDKRFATLVQNSIIKQTKQYSRGVKEAGFYVIKYTNMPAVLVETGFISNPKEENFLFDPQSQTVIANAIADALVEFKNS